MKRILALVALASVIVIVRDRRRLRIVGRAWQRGAARTGGRARAVGRSRPRGFGADVGAEGIGAGVDTSGVAAETSSMDDVATGSGLSAVDPQPLTHVAGEGVVPGELEEAYDAPRALRDRLPRSGEELP